MQTLARSHSVEAIERAVELMLNSKSEAIQLAAISMILERAFGKPKQEIEVANQGATLEEMLTAIWAAKHASEAAQEAAKKPDGA
jgi:hypothetical protein